MDEWDTLSLIPEFIPVVGIEGTSSQNFEVRHHCERDVSSAASSINDEDKCQIQKGLCWYSIKGFRSQINRTCTFFVPYTKNSLKWSSPFKLGLIPVKIIIWYTKPVMLRLAMAPHQDLKTEGRQSGQSQGQIWDNVQSLPCFSEHFVGCHLSTKAGRLCKGICPKWKHKPASPIPDSLPRTPICQLYSQNYCPVDQRMPTMQISNTQPHQSVQQWEHRGSSQSPIERAFLECTLHLHHSAE